jgi:endoglucanase
LPCGRKSPRVTQTNTWIAGYDLINEPNWTFENRSNLNGCDDQTNAPLRQLLVDITAAIRQVDTNHMIILEGNCWAGNYNGLLPPWDDNLVISFHKYWDAPTAASLQPWVDKRNQWNMPVWLGESGENSNEWFRDVVRHCEQANIGWAWWPWKKIGTISGPVIVQKPAGYQAILELLEQHRPATIHQRRGRRSARARPSDTLRKLFRAARCH